MADVKITGVKETINALNLFVKDIKANQSLNREIGSTLAPKASALAPRRSGALAGSVGFEASAEKATIYAGSATVPYAGVIEYGWPTRGITEQPFLRPGVNKNIGLVVSKYNDEIQKTIRQYNLQ
tara:strand:+ start:1653 stop:2027 length:375 start_codon:yes stop_codon:yes gene_type:complete